MSRQCRVLLVDDEPLVLAGIKIMIDWQACDCVLVGSARNGQQAMDIMQSEQVDIVFSDINMPVMNGIELIKRAHIKYPNIVFVMLTNHQEFSLAQESLRYRAVDYIIKNQMEAETLTKCLQNAIKEAHKRREATFADTAIENRTTNEKRLIKDSIAYFMSSSFLQPEGISLLEQNGMLKKYVFIWVLLRYPAHIAVDSSIQGEHKRLYSWQMEVCKEAARNCLNNFISVELELRQQSILFMTWSDEANNLEELACKFGERLTTASFRITGINPCYIVTREYSGQESLKQCRKELFEAREYLYNSSAGFVNSQKITPLNYQPLALSGIAGRFKLEMRSNNLIGCNNLFDYAINEIRQIIHEKSQADWVCTEVYAAITEGLKEMDISSEEPDVFTDSSAGYIWLASLVTKKDIIKALEKMKQDLRVRIEPSALRYADIVDQAKKYVEENIDKKISLSDVAKSIGISSGYLSSQFKKQCKENFVDYINRSKIARACTLIRQNEYRISQIGYMLSFENAYYFTRVFKKHMGMTPSEYQDQIRKENKEQTQETF